MYNIPEYSKERIMKARWSCFVNSTDKILFFNIPKNASTSISRALRLSGFKEVSKLSKYSRLNANYYNLIKTHTEVKNYFKITVVRNPYTRLVSSFCQMFMSNVIKRTPHLDECFRNKKTGEEKFIAFMDMIKETFFDEHVMPQTYYLKNADDNYIPINFFIIFERLKMDYAFLSKKFNFYKNLQHSVKNNFPTLEKIAKRIIIEDQSVRQIVDERYEEDISFYRKVCLSRNIKWRVK